MVEYSYVCDNCKVEYTIQARMGYAPASTECRGCNEQTRRLYNKSHILAFKPYKTDIYDGVTREIGSRAERDAILESCGLTHDSGKYVKPSNESAVDSVTLDDVKRTIDAGEAEKPIDVGADELSNCRLIGRDSD